MAKEPNHICKNPKCLKNFYACDDCDKNRGIHWRSLCCSVECFKEYMTFIEERDNPKQEAVVEEIVADTESVEEVVATKTRKK
jgi:hypothetical protein